MKCFVLMPFGDHRSDPAHFRKMEDLYSAWIKPTVESIRTPSGDMMACHRGDKEFGSGSIIEHVMESIVCADLVIADLTGKNPNVFYELGVRHATGTGTILISEGIDHVPFDLRPLRVIVYEYTPSGMLGLRRDLEKAVQAFFSNSKKVDNPVRRFILENMEAKTLTSSPEQQIIQSLQSHIISLKQDLLEQFAMTRDLMRVATSPEPAADSFIAAAHRFEGIWKDPDNGSIFCVKLVGNSLRIPYCYAGDNRSIGHVFNCVLENDVLTGRFEWLGRPLNGFLVFRTVEQETLSGGWCLTENVPLEARTHRQMAKLFPSDRMISLTVRREAGLAYPKWALEYFDRFRTH
jgi:hypothetical protein